jgi:hypothetical protein
MGCVYKIYKGEFVYYGSTNNFKRRMMQHKCTCYNKNRPEYNFKLYKTIRANGGWESFNKVIIEDNIETDKEWKSRETYYLRHCKCNMNTDRNMTEEEYTARKRANSKVWNQKNKEKIKAKYEKNKEKIKASQKAYKVKNKEKIKAKRNKKIICECGRTISQGRKTEHIKTQIHIKLMVAKLMEEYISQII